MICRWGPNKTPAPRQAGRTGSGESAFERRAVTTSAFRTGDSPIVMRPCTTGVSRIRDLPPLPICRRGAKAVGVEFAAADTQVRTPYNSILRPLSPIK